MSGSVSVHRRFQAQSNDVQWWRGCTDACSWIEGGLCEELTLWCVVVWYWLQVGRMEEWTSGGAHILMSATGDNSCYGL